jgi:hypothetical protein
MGAPGLASETWDPSNQFPLKTSPSPLSSREAVIFLISHKTVAVDEDGGCRWKTRPRHPNNGPVL